MRLLCEFYTTLEFSSGCRQRTFFSDPYIISFLFLKAGMCVSQFDRDQRKWLSQATTTDQLKSAHLFTDLFY